MAHRQRRSTPSFSSSLLEAIYRSIDEPDNNSPASAVPDEQSFSSQPQFVPPLSIRPTGGHHRCHLFANSTSSNSSSFGGFSSSDVESTSSSRPYHHPPRDISDRPQVESAAAVAKKKRSSIRSRIRQLRGPDSPGNRLAAFLNTIFSTASRGTKAKKIPVGGSSSASSSMASEAISCVRKTPSTGCCGRQSSVRFCTAVADGDEKPKVPMDRDRRRAAEMMLRELEMEVEDGESDCESESSSDLFELECLSAAGRFADGLPVYETTNLEINLAISNGLIM
ncbi:hypothetical protein HPP92_003961 [Vanilla planifolia]|uniref:Uncharacterized protein n=1 Tax=Vanilla planifolia TaxID=51239 RepID=A0A835VKF0_VANPL|nr:hypothetical protein HPP92_003961 [Vanilla planifolia]